MQFLESVIKYKIRIIPITINEVPAVHMFAIQTFFQNIAQSARLTEFLFWL